MHQESLSQDKEADAIETGGSPKRKKKKIKIVKDGDRRRGRSLSSTRKKIKAGSRRSGRRQGSDISNGAYTINNNRQSEHKRPTATTRINMKKEYIKKQELDIVLLQ
jgi:hypothetical protein